MCTRGEVYRHERIGQIFLKARYGPTIVQTIGEEDVASILHHETSRIESPMLYQLVWLRCHAKSGLTVFRQPCQRPWTGRKHTSLLIETNRFYQQGTCNFKDLLAGQIQQSGQNSIQKQKQNVHV